MHRPEMAKVVPGRKCATYVQHPWPRVRAPLSPSLPARKYAAASASFLAIYIFVPHLYFDGRADFPGFFEKGREIARIEGTRVMLRRNFITEIILILIFVETKEIKENSKSILFEFFWKRNFLEINQNSDGGRIIIDTV